MSDNVSTDSPSAGSTPTEATSTEATSTESPSTRVTRTSLAALLVGTAVLYLWNLSANGWANSFYTAAIQAGSQSWKAWFFGSSDMANSITVDKPPASLWIPGLVVRAFGLNSWTVLVPEVLMGVASVFLLYLITRRVFGHWAGIGAGVVLALTPVAALMFRFDNPEALLILLMIGACGALLKAIETGRLRWMIAAGLAIGFGFLAKQLEVMLIVPAMVIVYFVAAPGTWLRRAGHLLAALASLVVGAGWWVLAVTLWPASSRPYIGGSQNNSILELTFGYNGLGRLSGNEEGSVVPGGGMGEGPGGFGGGPGGGPGGSPGGGPGGGMWGRTGFWRMFDAEQGGQIAWLIPAAVITFIAAIVVIGRAPRTDRRRTYLLLFAGWLVSMAGTFSFMAGIFHSYYTAALAPAIAAVLAASVAVLWPHREQLWIRLTLAVATWATAGWGFALLARSADFVPWLRWSVLVLGIAAGAALLVTGGKSWQRRVAAAAATVAILAGLAGPTAYTIDTIAAGTQGSIVSAGPSSGMGPGGHGGLGGHGGGPGGRGGGPGGRHGMRPPGQMSPMSFGEMKGPGGGLLNSSEPSERLTATLRTDADDFTWVAAAVGSNEASGYQIATGYSVMPIGGFNGTDPSPTLAEFKQLVADGAIHYFIGGSGRGFGGSSDSDGTSAQIKQWVEANFTSTTVDDVTLYDLSGG